MPSRETGTIPELDALRGLAIALVLATHADGWVMPGSRLPVNTAPLRPLSRTARAYALHHPSPVVTVSPLPFWHMLLNAGRSGVSLFFVLSAFLLSQPFWREWRGGPRVDLSAFARRRCWRILPLYALVVLGTAAVLATTFADLAKAGWYLAFVPIDLIPKGWEIQPTFYAGVWWSLSTEVQFYLLLPLVAVAARSRAGRLVATLVAVALVAVYSALVTHVLGYWVSFPGVLALSHAVVGYGPLFGWGMVAAYIAERWPMQSAPPRGTGSADLALAAGFMVAYMAFAWFEYAVGMRALESTYFAWHLGEGAVYAALVLGVLRARLRWRAVVTARPFVWLGQISYSVYLLHEPIYGAGFTWLRRHGAGSFATWTPMTVVLVLGLVGVILAVSHLSFRRIEQPGIARGRWRGIEKQPTFASAA